MNDIAFLPFLRCDPSKPVQPRSTAVRVAQRPKPAIQQPVSPELGGIAFKRLSDEPRIHLGHIHRPLDETSFGFSETVAKESMTWRERFAFFFFFGVPVTFRIVPGNVDSYVTMVQPEPAPVIIARTELFGQRPIYRKNTETT